MEEINGGEGGCGEREMDRRAGRRQRYGIRKRERGGGREEGHNGHLEGPTSVSTFRTFFANVFPLQGGQGVQRIIVG